MKQLMSIFAGIGLTVAGLTAVPAVADAQPGRHAHRDHGPRAHHDDRRRWDDRRHWENRRGWNDRRGRDHRREWSDRRRGDERRRWDERRDRYGYRGERVVPGWSREAAAMGVDYRGPCRYVIRNGRRVCG